MAALCLAACLFGSLRSDTQAQVVHPTPENMPARGELADYIAATDPGPDDAGLQALAEWLSGATEVMRLGVLEGEIHEMVGFVRDVAANSHGDIFVLDSQSRRVLVHGSEGNYKRSIGGPGEGPGEFMDPAAVEIDSQDRVIVADRMSGVTVFEPVDTSFTVAATVPLPFSPGGVCAENGLIYATGVSGDSVNGNVHAYAYTGEHIRSFGKLYVSDNSSARINVVQWACGVPRGQRRGGNRR